MILRFIVFLILFFIIYRVIKYFIKYLSISSSKESESFKNIHPSDKYKDVEEAKFIEIKDEKKQNEK